MADPITTYKLLLGTLLLLAIAWYCRYHWKRRRLYEMASKISGPVALPLVGNALYFAVPNTEIIFKLLRTMSEYKSPIRMWFGQQLAVFVWNPRDIEIVLNSPHALEKEMMIYKHYHFALGDGLGTAPAKLWKRNRRIITPTFKQKNIDGFLKVFIEQSDILVQQLKHEVVWGIFDCFRYIDRCTMDMICETAFGVKINAQTTNSPVIKWVDRAMDIMSEKIQHIWYHLDFIFKRSAMSKELDFHFSQFRDFIDEIISEWKKVTDNESKHETEDIAKPKTFLQQLLKISKEGACFTNKQLRDEVITFILAGSETTASTLGFVLIIMGLFPDVQETVYQEIMDVIGPNRAIDIEDLQKLKYMEQVVKETMRILPVAITTARSATEDIKLARIYQEFDFDGQIQPRTEAIRPPIYDVQNLFV